MTRWKLESVEAVLSACREFPDARFRVWVDGEWEPNRTTDWILDLHQFVMERKAKEGLIEILLPDGVEP